MQITTCLGEIICFIGKVNVAVAVGTTLATLLVAMIIAVVACWFHKSKSKEGGLSQQLFIASAVVVRQYAFSFILHFNKKIHCFARDFFFQLFCC